MSFVHADPASTLRRVVASLNTVCDWVEEGDVAEAIELCNYCISDLERLLDPDMREPGSGRAQGSRDNNRHDPEYHHPHSATAA